MSNDGSYGGQGYPSHGYDNGQAYAGQDQPTYAQQNHAQQGYDANGYGQPGQQGYDQNGAHAYHDQTQANPAQFGQPQGQGPAVGQSISGAGFFQALFDFSFSSFITPKVVKFVYALSVAALGLFWLVMLISAFTQSTGAGLIVLFFGPLGILLYLVFIRMTLEFYVATVRMSEDIHQRLR